jgi:hypothetical protein
VKFHKILEGDNEIEQQKSSRMHSVVFLRKIKVIEYDNKYQGFIRLSVTNKAIE